MFRALSAQQIKRIDEIAIRKFLIPSLHLMENAGQAVFQEALKELKSVKFPFVVIICGTGNNGGDGLVVARYLWGIGIKIQTYLLGRAASLKQDPATNIMILKNLRIRYHELKSVNPNFKRNLKKADLIIDAVFGVGLNRPIENYFKNIFQAVNLSGKNILSIDVPSGLDATNGKVWGSCIKATTTVTLTRPKKGFFKHDGPKHVGRIVVKSIGIPKTLLNQC